MNVHDLLKGKKVKVMTEVKVEVMLEIDSIERNLHSEDLEPSTPQNDWWPATRDWYTYTVKFTNGAKKEYRSIEEIEFQ